MIAFLVGLAVAFPVGYAVGDWIARSGFRHELERQARIERTRAAMARMRESKGPA